MKRVIIAGSPRSNGRTAKLAETLFEACIEDCPEDEVYLIPVSELEIGPCIGCGGCKKAVEVQLEDGEGTVRTELRHMCVFDDDMNDVYDLLSEADELIVVSPVFFSGAPAPMKALLDRLQPFFWQWSEERKVDLEEKLNARRLRRGEQPIEYATTDEEKAQRQQLLEGKLLKKRPAVLHVIGEGGDANGYVPLVSEVRSALAVAGFKLERMFDWVGKIDEHGEILEDASEHGLPSLGGALTSFTYDDQGNIMLPLEQIFAGFKLVASDEEDGADAMAADASASRTPDGLSSDSGNKPEKKKRPRLDFAKVEEPARKKPASKQPSSKSAKGVRADKPAGHAASVKSGKGGKNDKGARGGKSDRGAKSARQAGASKSSTPKSSKGKRRG